MHRYCLLFFSPLLAFALIAGCSDVVEHDFSIYKLSETGDVQWSKIIDHEKDEFAFTGIQTKNGEYVISGITSDVGSKTSPMLIRFDANGSPTIEKSYPVISGFWKGSMVQEISESGILAVYWGQGITAILSVDDKLELLWSQTVNSSGKRVAISTDSRDSFLIGYDPDVRKSGERIILRSMMTNSGEIQWERILSIHSTNGVDAIVSGKDAGHIIISTPWIIRIDEHGNVTSTGLENTTRFIAVSPDPRNERLHALFYNDPVSPRLFGFVSDFEIADNGTILSRRDIPGMTDIAGKMGDGGYVYAGGGLPDAFSVIRLNESGSVLWNRTVSHPPHWYSEAIFETQDKGLLIVANGWNTYEGVIRNQ